MCGGGGWQSRPVGLNRSPWTGLVRDWILDPGSTLVPFNVVNDYDAAGEDSISLESGDKTPISISEKPFTADVVTKMHETEH